jgi:transposase InsO family protein
LELPRSSHRYEPRRQTLDEQILLRRLRRFAVDHPRRGYRRFWETLQNEGVEVSLKKIYRLWKLYHSG